MEYVLAMRIHDNIDMQPSLSFDGDPAYPACSFKVEKLSNVKDSSGASVRLPDEFYDFLLTAYSEQHAEAASIKNVMSDTFLAITTGAMPIQVSLQGMLPMTGSTDSRLDFHALYNQYFRGTKLQAQKLVLRLFVRRTVLTLYIQSMNMAVSSQMEDMVQFSINGVGSSYQITPSG